MLLKHILAASLVAAFYCQVAAAEGNPFLPPAATTPASLGDQGLSPLPPPLIPGTTPVLPSAPLPLLPPPQLATQDERPIGKVNGELIYKDGNRYNFKAEKKTDPAKLAGNARPKPRKKLVRSVIKTTVGPASDLGVAAVEPSLNGGPKLIKVLPNASQAAANPTTSGKTAGAADKPAPATNKIQSGAAAGKAPIKAITEKK